MDMFSKTVRGIQDILWIFTSLPRYLLLMWFSGLTGWSFIGLMTVVAIWIRDRLGYSWAGLAELSVAGAGPMPRSPAQARFWHIFHSPIDKEYFHMS